MLTLQRSMKRSSIQVKPNVYQTLDYIDKPRWISLWHQINEVAATRPTSVLEVGTGNGIVSYTLRLLKIRTTTVDIDARLEPDQVGDIRKLPFKNGEFDTILCAEVLEHIPFDDFKKALKELYRVCRRYVVVSLPHDYLTYFWLSIKLIPFIPTKHFFITLPRNLKHKFDGQHYWEIGKKGYSLNRISYLFKRNGFSIEKNYRLTEFPYHRFFVLKKK